MHTCPLSWFSLVFSKFLSVSWLEHQISQEIPTMAFFKIFSLFSRCPQYMVESWRGFHTLFNIDVENVQKAFGWFLESIQTLTKMTFFIVQRFLDISRFFTQGLVCKCLMSDEKLICIISDENHQDHPPDPRTQWSSFMGFWQHE